MRRLKKIIINIDKNGQNRPALVSYETEKGIFKVPQLDTECEEIANSIFKILFPHFKALGTNAKIYCYNYKNKQINLSSDITTPEDHYLLGCDIDSIERIIQKIKHVTSLKKSLIPFYVNINNKTFYLNERIIQIKKGIQNPEIIDIETYGMFLKEFRPKLYENIMNNKKSQE